MTAAGTPAETSQKKEASSERTSRRPHRFLVWALVVIATIMLFISAWATLVSKGILNPDKWAATSKELLADDEIRGAVSTYIVGQLYSPDAVAQKLEQALPPSLAGISGAAAGGLEQVAVQATDRILNRPRVQQIWADANKAAMTAVTRLIENKGKYVSAEGGDVVLDLRALLTQVAVQLGGSGQRIQQLPPEAGQVVIMQSQQLGFLQKLLNALRILSFWFLIGAGLLYAGAVYLARGWRRVAVRNISISFIVVALLVLVLRRFVGNGVIESLVADTTYKAAALNTWAIATEALRTAAVGAIVLGLIGVLATAILGPARWAVSTRRWLAPGLRTHAWVGYGLIVVVGLLFLLWSPTQRASWIPAVVIMVLLAVWYAILRRQCVEEFPPGTVAAPPVTTGGQA